MWLLLVPLASAASPNGASLNGPTGNGITGQGTSPNGSGPNGPGGQGPASNGELGRAATGLVLAGVAVVDGRLVHTEGRRGCGSTNGVSVTGGSANAPGANGVQPIVIDGRLERVDPR